MLSHWHRIFQRQLEDMRRKNESLNLKQSAKLDDVVRYIRDLGTRFLVAGPEALAKSLKPLDIESL